MWCSLRQGQDRPRHRRGHRTGLRHLSLPASGMHPKALPPPTQRFQAPVRRGRPPANQGAWTRLRPRLSHPRLSVGASSLRTASTTTQIPKAPNPRTRQTTLHPTHPSQRGRRTRPLRLKTRQAREGPHSVHPEQAHQATTRARCALLHRVRVPGPFRPRTPLLPKPSYSHHHRHPPGL